jgi:hypothetical protein
MRAGLPGSPNFRLAGMVLPVSTGFLQRDTLHGHASLAEDEEQ